jgi:hypothetical protein
VTRAYAEKYDTEASGKRVRGFAEPHRVVTTVEFVPASASQVLAVRASATARRADAPAGPRHAGRVTRPR